MNATSNRFSLFWLHFFLWEHKPHAPRRIIPPPKARGTLPPPPPPHEVETRSAAPEAGGTGDYEATVTAQDQWKHEIGKDKLTGVVDFHTASSPFGTTVEAMDFPYADTQARLYYLCNSSGREGIGMTFTSRPSFGDIDESEPYAARIAWDGSYVVKELFTEIDNSEQIEFQNGAMAAAFVEYNTMSIELQSWISGTLIMRFSLAGAGA